MKTRLLSRLAPLLFLLIQSGAYAQEIVRFDEDLDSKRPEAWALNYTAASTLMTGFGSTPVLAPWKWSLAVDLGYVPRLSESQQRVGFNGTKQEDLNRSPVFGRIRVTLGLPGEFVADLGYTPPVTVSGTKALDLFALAIGRRLYERDNFAFSMRLFGQHGRANGDITCPAHLAGAPLEENPYDCRAPSDDQVTLNYYGIDGTAAWNVQSWNLYGTAGIMRTRLETQVDALTADVRDRSLLTADSSLPFFTLGVRKDLDARWSLGAELLHVPLKVQRQLGAATTSDPLTSLRLQVVYRFE
jgi:hypothetical protein